MKQLLLLTFLGIVLFFASCEQVELNDLQEFELKIEQESDTIIQLSWTKANTSNFKKYIIVRSPEQIMDEDRPTDNFVLAEINDFNKNSLTDIITKLSANYHYRVYIELEDRYLISNEQHVHFDETYPLFVSHFIQTEQVQFTWQPNEISSFNRFILAFSDNPIYENIIEVLDLEHVIINGATVNTTTYLTTNPLGVYYKLFVDLGDRIISTESLATSGESIAIFSGYTGIIADFKDDNSIYIKGSDTLYVFDYLTEEIKYSVNTPSLHNLSLNKRGQDNELLLYEKSTGNSSIMIYDASTMNYKLSYPLSFNFVNGNDILGQNDLIFISTSNLTIFNRADGSVLGSHSFNGSNEERYTAKLDDTKNEFIELSKTQVHYYEFNNNGSLITHQSKFITSTDIVKNIAVSPDKQYFAGYESGEIHHRNLNTILSIPGNESYNAFAFSEAGDKIYAASYGRIYTYSFPSFNLEEVVDKNIYIEHMVVDDHKLIIIGTESANNPQNTYIKILDL